MKDEIKEMLDNPKILMLSYGDYISLNDYVKLKDYITNLQQDNTMYAQLKDEYEEEIKDLQQENEKLKSRIEEITKIYQNESSYRTELETKYVQLQQENQKNKKIIKDVYDYLDEKKDVPEWWDTDFFTCMNMLRDGKLTFNDWIKKGDDEK